MEKTYDVDYFIAKFEAIPEELWIVGDLGNRDKHCALGHCMTSSGMAYGLSRIFDIAGYSVVSVNNGFDPDFRQRHPKARILAALYDIKRKQYPQLTHPPVTAEQVIEELEGVTNITA